MDAFLADFEVSTWAVNSMIDFSSREKIPVRKQQKLLGSWLMSQEFGQ